MFLWQLHILACGSARYNLTYLMVIMLLRHNLSPWFCYSRRRYSSFNKRWQTKHLSLPIQPVWNRKKLFDKSVWQNYFFCEWYFLHWTWYSCCQIQNSKSDGSRWWLDNFRRIVIMIFVNFYRHRISNFIECAMCIWSY